MTALGASPDGATVLAATTTGLHTSSTSGSAWSAVPDAPALMLLDWADATRVVGMDQSGAVFVSSDAGHTWKEAATKPVGPPQAVGAGIVDGRVEILAVTRTAVVISTDGGSTFTPLP